MNETMRLKGRERVCRPLYMYAAAPSGIVFEGERDGETVKHNGDKYSKILFTL